MDQLAKFEALDDVSDVAQLRAMVREAAGVARQAMAERDAWQRRYASATADLVAIPQVSLDDLARMGAKRDGG